MNKQEFIGRLSERLSLLKPEDKKNAIEFYEEYFNDAGEEAEGSIIEELGTPEKLAEEILSFYKNSYSGDNKSIVKQVEENSISSFVFEVYSSNIYVEDSPSGIFEYRLENISEDEVKTNIENGTFYLSENVSEFFTREGFGNFFKNFSRNFFNDESVKRKIWVYIPQEMKTEYAEFNSRLGSIKISDVRMRKIKVSLTCGSLHINDCESKELNLSTAAGSIKITDIKSEKINLYSASGAIKLNDVEVNEIKSSTGAGNISISDISTEFLQASSGAGNIVCTDMEADKCNINTGAGNCKITDSDLNISKITTGAGNIKIQGSLGSKSDITSSIGSVTLNLDGSLEDYDLLLNAKHSNIKINGRTMDEHKRKDSSDNPNAKNKISVSVQFGSINIKTEDR